MKLGWAIGGDRGKYIPDWYSWPVASGSGDLRGALALRSPGGGEEEATDREQNF